MNTLPLKTYIPWNNSFEFGAGYNILTQSIQPSALIDHENLKIDESDSKTSISIRCQTISNMSEINETLQAGFEAGTCIYGADISASASFMNNISTKANSASILITIEKLWSKVQRTIGEKLNPDIEITSDFRNHYGDYFISGQKCKASAYIMVKIESNSKTEASKIAASLRANVKNIANLEANLEKQNSNQSSNSKIEVLMKFIGVKQLKTLTTTPDKIMENINLFLEDAEPVPYEAELTLYKTLNSKLQPLNWNEEILEEFKIINNQYASNIIFLQLAEKLLVGVESPPQNGDQSIVTKIKTLEKELKKEKREFNKASSLSELLCTDNGQEILENKWLKNYEEYEKSWVKLKKQLETEFNISISRIEEQIKKESEKKAQKRNELENSLEKIDKKIGLLEDIRKSVCDVKGEDTAKNNKKEYLIDNSNISNLETLGIEVKSQRDPIRRDSGFGSDSILFNNNSKRIFVGLKMISHWNDKTNGRWNIKGDKLYFGNQQSNRVDIHGEKVWGIGRGCHWTAEWFYVDQDVYDGLVKQRGNIQKDLAILDKPSV